jgi:hypothetical protein
VRWDGLQGQIAPGSESISTDGALNSVIAISDTNVWVFGVEGSWVPLVAHWDGKRWTLIANEQGKDTLHLPLVVPDTPLSAAKVTASTSSSSSSSSPAMWIVGTAYSGCETCQNPLILAGSGGHWSAVPANLLPADAEGSAQVTLAAIDAVTANDIWTVGSYLTQDVHHNSTSSAYILHWDGARWVSLPRQQRQPWDTLMAISATSAADIWAVGESATYLGGESHTLIEHWNGSQWTIVSCPNPGARVRDICL